jgi:hypothetical protein
LPPSGKPHTAGKPILPGRIKGGRHSQGGPFGDSNPSRRRARVGKTGVRGRLRREALRLRSRATTCATNAP